MKKPLLYHEIFKSLPVLSICMLAPFLHLSICMLDSFLETRLQLSHPVLVVFFKVLPMLVKKCVQFSFSTEKFQTMVSLPFRQILLPCDSSIHCLFLQCSSLVLQSTEICIEKGWNHLLRAFSFSCACFSIQ